MRKLRRVVVIALGALIALGVVLLLCVNLYVQSQVAQAKIQQQLTRTLGVPLKIRSMSVTPWGGLELSGITIPQTSSVGSRYFLEAKTFRLRVRYPSLFSQRLVINVVSLINPRVVWPQDAEGKWRLPTVQAAQPHVVPITHAPPIPPSAVEIEPVPTSASPPVTAAATVASSTGLAPAPQREPRRVVAPEVRRVSVKNGDFSFLDEAGRLVASFSGVDFRTNIRSAQTLYGDAKAARISLRDRFFLDQLRSPLRYEPDVLELSKITARVANGEVNGYFAIQPEAEDAPFTTSVTFRDVLADQIVEHAGGPKGMVKGKLEGNFQASGITGDTEALSG